MSNTSNYRPEIDGLRAIAVLAVIINHFQTSLLPSGFLGVDIFFVISGYVVTSSLSDKNNHSLKDFLVSFYARRMKRLVPALVVSVVVTAVIGCLFIPHPGESLWTGIASLFGASNLYLFQQSSDYFGQAMELNLFTHTWSLGVEEQFYFVFPILIASTQIARSKKYSSDIQLLFWLLILGALSYFSYFTFRFAKPMGAFYLMPMRFWELGAGAFIYIINKKQWFSAIISDFGAILLSTLFVFLIILNLYLPLSFQTFSTTAIVLSTSFLLLVLQNPSPIKKILSHPKLVRIGLVSYSIYLWHWPVLALARHTVGVRALTLPFLLLAIILFSWGSYMLIERPWRERKMNNKESIVSAFIIMFLGFVSIVVLAKPLRGKLFLGNVVPPVVEPFKGSTNSANCRWDYKADVADYAEIMKDCEVLKDSKNKTLFISGDSHADALGNLAHTIAQTFNLNLNVKTAGGCLFPSTFVYEYNGMESDRVNECRLFQMNRLKEILSKAKPGDIVLNANYYGYYLMEPVFNDPTIKVERFLEDGKSLTAVEARAKYVSDLKVVARQLKEKGVNLIIMAPQMQFKLALKDCTHQWFNFRSLSEKEKCDINRSDFEAHRLPFLEALVGLEQEGEIIVWDPLLQYCPNERCSYYSEEGKGYFSDRDHYSGEGARLLVPHFVNLLKTKVPIL